MKKMSLKAKILIPTITLLVAAFVVLNYVTIHQFNSTSTELQDEYVEEYAYHNLYKTKAIVEVPMNKAQSLATALGEFQKDGLIDRQGTIDMLREWLNDNDSYLGVYTAWEPNAFDGMDSEFAYSKYHDRTGRFIPYVYKNNGSVTIEALADYDTLEYYQGPKTLGREVITDPYEYEAGGGMLQLVSMISPIMVDGKFKGIVGVDVAMTELQGLVDNTKLFDTGYAFVVSNDGTIVAHPDHDIIGTNVTSNFDTVTEQAIKDSIINGSIFSTVSTSNTDGIQSHVVFVSEEVGQSDTNWSVGVSVPVREKTATSDRGILFATMIAAIFGISIIIAIIIITERSISRPMTASINQIQQASIQVSDFSTSLSVASQQLSAGSSEQAASIEETSASMDETASMVQQNAENTIQAKALSMEATDAATEGEQKMQEMITSMEELKKSSADISNIIKVIEDIAFQTNMLALNAAVEAARAGDAGLGFAVVAEEVRNLAQKSAKAAKDTAGIIDRNIELSEKGVSTSMGISDSLKEIMKKFQNVNQLMGEIAVASDEQSKGTAQVTLAISQMEQVVQSNAVSAEETASSSEELHAQAAGLSEIVTELSELIKGAKAQTNSKGVYRKHEKDDTDYYLKGKEVNNSSSSQKLIVSPEDIIPLDNSDDF